MDQVWLDYADRLEEIARRKFPDAQIPKRPIVYRLPVCHVHKLPMLYNAETDEHICPSPGCPWRAYEDEELDTEAARVYYQEVAEKTRDAEHGGGSRRRRKWRKQGRRPQSEGSPNAKAIPLAKRAKPKT